MIPALQALSDAILAVHEAYADSSEWDELIDSDPILRTLFCDHMDDSLFMLRMIDAIVYRAEGDIVTDWMIKEVKKNG